MQAAERTIEESLALKDEEHGAPPESLGELLRSAERACAAIPPLWGLDQFVAVNPFWGLRDGFAPQALSGLGIVSNESSFPSAKHFRSKLESGELNERHLTEAIALLKDQPAISHLNAAEVMAALRQDSLAISELPTTIAQLFDNRLGTEYAELIQSELSRFLALYCDRGQAALPSTLSQLPLFDAWLEFATNDRSLALAGLGDAHRFFERFRGEDSESILETFSKLVPSIPELLQDLLLTEIFSCRGWAAYLQHLDFEDSKRALSPKRVLSLLAIRSAYTQLLFWRHPFLLEQSKIESWITARRVQCDALNPAHLIICQQAFEIAFRERLATQFLSAQKDAPQERPRLQAMFCIDVRSEGFRRNLEQLSPSIETYGFAGFFGLSFAFTESGARAPAEQYPVLLQRRFSVREVADPVNPEYLPATSRARNALALFIRVLRQSICSGFSYVESLGVFYGAKLLRQSLHPASPRQGAGTRADRTDLISDLTPPDRVATALAILKNSSLRFPLAPIVLLCGHRGCVTNNPYAAGLDCGACGGHGGESNARFAAALLNDPAVRSAARESGIEIPADTKFIPAVHLTTTEEVELLEPVDSSVVADAQQLRVWLAMAAERSRGELSISLGGVDSSLALAPQFESRSRDWSELRPEWALARNAGFIAARRSRTRAVPLHNRCFLHEYDAARDTDYSVLELLMTAPMVVASWINLQYYGSAVMPKTFGSGNKTIHNVVGQLGTVLGNGGDLGIGLPWQSVHTGDALFHEPMRLQVVIEAPTSAIDAIIAKHPLLQELVDNHWLSISALDPEQEVLRTRYGRGQWRYG